MRTGSEEAEGRKGRKGWREGEREGQTDGQKGERRGEKGGMDGQTKTRRNEISLFDILVY